MNSVWKILLIICGWLALLLAIIGIFLPLLPTTPLVILAGFCFSKGSERLHQWLLNLRTFGPMLRDWEQHGIISKKGKMFSVGMIIPLFSYTLIFVQVSLWIKVLILCIGTWVVWFILSRPSSPSRL